MHLSKNHLNWDHLAVIAFELHQDILNVQIYITLHYIDHGLWFRHIKPLQSYSERT